MSALSSLCCQKTKLTRIDHHDRLAQDPALFQLPQHRVRRRLLAAQISPAFAHETVDALDKDGDLLAELLVLASLVLVVRGTF